MDLHNDFQILQDIFHSSPTHVQCRDSETLAGLACTERAKAEVVVAWK